MQRRLLFPLVGGVALAWPLHTRAQTPVGAYRLGVLSSGAPIDDNSINWTALVHDLAQYGYVQGRNLTIERRTADGHADRLPGLIAELVAGKADVIVTIGFPAALTAKRETALPMVTFGAGDPVGTGLVASLSLPGGNITGISDVSAELTPKRLDLLKQFAPALRRVAVLWDADDPWHDAALRYRAAEAGARTLGVSIQPLGVREAADFERAFAIAGSDPPDAILVVSDELTNLHRKLVFAFAAAHRLPAIYEYDFIVRDGDLMSMRSGARGKPQSRGRPGGSNSEGGETRGAAVRAADALRVRTQPDDREVARCRGPDIVDRARRCGDRMRHPMRRRQVFPLVGAAVLAWPRRAPAQTPDRVSRIGLLISGAPMSAANPQWLPLIRGLARYGYVPGRNLEFESVGAEMHAERLPGLAAGLEAKKARWCMNTRILTVIPAGQMAHRASEGRIGDPDARTVPWQAVLFPDAGTHAVQVQRTAPAQNPHGEISCDELA